MKTLTLAPPAVSLASGRYQARFVSRNEDLDRALRLRYQVFNLELNEGLALSAITGRDEDDFDRRFHHLIVEERNTGELVGTYRMQTAEMAAAGGYYSAGLFCVEMLSREVLGRAVEIGRACVARPHRSGRVLHLLWRGLAAYLAAHHKTALFGCCSLTTQDGAVGWAAHRLLAERGDLHPRLRVDPLPATALPGAAAQVAPASRIPALFQAYLDIGAKALGAPAIDREFKTIDWLVYLDLAELAPSARRSLLR